MQFRNFRVGETVQTTGHSYSEAEMIQYVIRDVESSGDVGLNVVCHAWGRRHHQARERPTARRPSTAASPLTGVCRPV